MNPKLKQTRARSEDKKADQFERILEAGKQLFLNRGPRGFSMRNLAEKLGMTKNNLYNYVESKRELWISIRNNFYNQFKKENLEIIKKHEGSKSDLILKLYKHYLDFADRDYDRFRMMFNVVEAPHSNKIGPIESDYREYRLLEGTKNLIQEAINEGEITQDAASVLTLFTYSVVLGVAYMQMIRSEQIRRTHSDPVWETMQLSQVDVSDKDFKEYALQVLEYILKNGSF